MRKNSLLVGVLLFVTLLTASCSRSEKPAAMIQEAGSAAYQDALGYEINVENPKRVAVLSGSLADAWLLAGGEIAAVTEDAGETIEITEEMVSLGALKSPSVETMLSEEIDFAILSATIAEHVKLRSTLEEAGIKTAYFDVETFADYEAMMQIMTALTADEGSYQKHVAAVRTEIETQLARADGSRPSILFLRAYSTGVKAKGSDSMTGGMLKDLDCVNIADSDNSLLEDLSMEAIIAADPDYIFVTTMGESQEAALEMVDQLLITHPAWSGLSAVRQQRYYVLPKELFHQKPNERWGESYRILADYLYGE